MKNILKIYRDTTIKVLGLILVFLFSQGVQAQGCSVGGRVTVNPQGGSQTALVLTSIECIDSNLSVAGFPPWLTSASFNVFGALVITSLPNNSGSTRIGDVLISDNFGIVGTIELTQASNCTAQTWYLDADGDGFRPGGISIATQCNSPGPGWSTTVKTAGDCNDNNASINPNTVWYLDADGDGFYPSGGTRTQCTSPGTGWSTSVKTAGDCNDSNSSINPNTVWYLDADGDGFYPSGGTRTQCTSPGTGWTRTVKTAGDCNDSNSSINPNTVWYLDADGDGFYPSGGTRTQCTSPGTGWSTTVKTPGDCNDGNSGINPNTIWYLDADGDGFYPSGGTRTQCTSPGTGWSTTVKTAGDCNDGNSSINPNTVWYLDADGDGFYPSGGTRSQCTSPGTGWGTASKTTGDCDDSNSDLNPNTIWYEDNNNDGFADEGAATVQQCTEPAGSWTLNPELNPCVILASEKQALIDFYNATGGPSWTASWDIVNTEPCDWIGVTIENGFVTRLGLGNNNITGPIPAALLQLTSLDYIFLRGNNLSGTIPANIDQLSNLTYINLSANDLTGGLPSSLGNLSGLQSLWLSENDFTGTVPTSLFGLSNIVFFDLSQNNLSGSVPAFNNLPDLRYIYLQSNNFSGTISLNNLPDLQRVYLYSNNFSGPLPSSLASFSSLQEVFVSNNNFSGVVPNLSGNTGMNVLRFNNNQFLFSDFEGQHTSYSSNIGTYTFAPQAKVDQEETLSVLENGTITLTSTVLTSPNNNYQWFKDGVAIPGATSKDYVISNATTDDAGTYYFEATNSVVTGLTLTRNNITLSVDPDPCGVSAAERQALLDLYASTNGDNWTNTLAGNQPWDPAVPVCDWFGVTVLNGDVTALDLNTNELVGTLNSSITDLIHLRSLFLNTNSISGNIPSDIDRLSELVSLRLYQNQLSGSIPSTIGGLSNLSYLHLGFNDLSGQIPVEISQLPSITFISFKSNEIDGSIPTAIGNLTTLQDLNLSGNNLTGPIPTEIGNLPLLDYLDLAGNNLSGSIPTQMGSLSNLQHLNLGGNSLSGNIPTELMNATNLDFVNLNSNLLSGSIPGQVGNLNQLEWLNLSGNQISGSIPVSVVTITTLERFIVTNNELNGEIPNFTGLSNLSHLQFGGNEFFFSNFELEHLGYQGNVGSYSFAPQAKVDEEETQSVFENGTITLTTSDLSSPNNSYQWFKDGVAIPGATSKDYVISNATTDDAGTYYFEATNSIVTGLTLTRNNITLSVNPDPCGVSAAERQALLDLYANTNGDNWTNTLAGDQPWDPAISVCDWFGVTVVNGAVTSVDLDRNSLVGTIPNSIGDLTNVTYFELAHNQLSGVIPDSIGDMSSLTTLFLEVNQLSGSIPTTIGNLSNLVQLKIGNNALTGPIPTEIGNLSSLNRLNLNENDLSGSLPTELGNLSNLVYMYMTGNELSGSIPSELGNLTNLRYFWLSNNQLTGSIPPELGNMTSAIDFHVDGNALTGTIPNELGNLVNLDRIRLERNQLTGPIPPEFGNFSVMRTMLLNDNLLSGSIPTQLGQLSDLATLHLHENQLTGNIPNELGQLSALKNLLLSQNLLTGSIPVELSQLPELQGLSLNENQLSGDIPSQFSTLPTLNGLNFISNNFVFSNFEGEHPLYVSNLGSYNFSPQAKVDEEEAQSVLENETITLTSTALTSPNNSYQWFKDGVAIPGATTKDYVISNADTDDAGVYYFEAINSVVTGLTLTRNDITLSVDPGTCDVSAAERQALLDLYASTNGDNWTNTLANNRPWDPAIPVCDWFGVLVIGGQVTELNLANNNLDGTLPGSLGDLTNLVQIHLSNDNITGVIPNEIGQMTSLETILLNNNNLSGALPTTLGNLSNLKRLTLIFNQLSGEIPSTFGQLNNLENLELGYNQLTGGIPTSIAQIQSLESVLLEDNLLSGPIAPDFSTLPNLGGLFFGTNAFVFSDFEVEHPLYVSNLASYSFSPQAKVDQEESLEVPQGNEITLSSTALTSTNNSYQWFKNGVAIPGATTKDYVISNADTDDAGVYYFEATNSIITGLTLTRNDITLTIGGPTEVCEEILVQSGSGGSGSIIDGSFELASNVIIPNNRNETLGGSGWGATQGTPDTFGTPYNNSNDPYLLDAFTSSPNGGICAGGLRIGNSSEAFAANINGLTPSTTYVVEFYQANVSNLVTPEVIRDANGFWEVSFGGLSNSSSSIFPSLSGNTSWRKQSLEFNASSSTQLLEFTVASTAQDQNNAYPVYMLIDGIRVYEKPADVFTTVCYDVFTQVFCNYDEDSEPTIGDLQAPNGGSVTWYSNRTGGTRYFSDEILADLPSFIVWADDGTGDRVAVEILFDFGSPLGDEYQFFDQNNNPTLADILVAGTNISWHSSFTSTTTLPLSTPLVDGTIYYAAQNGNQCRLAVQVELGIPDPIGSQYQEFCSTTNPTIADLVVQTTSPGYTIQWYSSETGGSLYNSTDPLENGQTYYAQQTDGTNTGENRIPFVVTIIDIAVQGQIQDIDIEFPNNSTVQDLADFYSDTPGIQWFSDPYEGTAYAPGAQLIQGETYYGRLAIGGVCDAFQVLAVTVTLADVVAPELITCIKFIPQPGRHYVIGAWAREQPVEAEPAGTSSFDEVKESFLELLDYLATKILNREEIPPTLVLKEDPSAPDVDDLLPYVRNTSDRNLTVYNFAFEKETLGGVEKSVGFSFALAPGSTERFVYLTPRVRLSFGIFGTLVDEFNLGYRFPIRNYEGLEIEFTDVAVVANKFRITSNFSVVDDTNPYLRTLYTGETVDSTSDSGIEASIQLFNYIEIPGAQPSRYDLTSIEITYKDISGADLPDLDGISEVLFEPKGAVIDGWQRIAGDFTVPTDAAYMKITLRNNGSNLNAYFDDVRILPFDGNMKSFVYDPITQRLMAELDENNYATFYEYDTEGGLVRVKKETERGVYTIQETRSGNAKLNVGE